MPSNDEGAPEAPAFLTGWRDRAVNWLTWENLWPWIVVAVLTVLSYTTRTGNVDSMRYLAALDPFHIYKNALYAYNHGFTLPVIDYLRFYPVGTFLPFEYIMTSYLPAAMYYVVKPFGLSFLDWAKIFPAVMGALMVPPVYLIGRLLWNRVAGVFAALFMAFNMSVFQRTSVGFFEKEPTAGPFLLFSVAFFIASWKTRSVKKAWMYGSASGITLAVAAMAWGGAQFFYYMFPAFVAVMTALRTMQVFFSAKYNREISYEYFTQFVAVFTPVTLIGVGLPAIFNPIKISFTSTPAMLCIVTLAFLWLGYALVNHRRTVEDQLFAAKALIGSGVAAILLVLLSPLYSQTIATYLNRVQQAIVRGKGTGVYATVAEGTAGSSNQIIGSLSAPGFSLGGVPVPSWVSSAFTWDIVGGSILFVAMLAGLYQYLTAEEFSERIRTFFASDEFAFFLLVWFAMTWWGTLRNARILFYVGPPASLIAGYGLWKAAALLRPKLSVIRTGLEEEVVDTAFYREAGKLVAILVVVGIIFFANFSVAQQQGSRGSSLHQYWEESLNWLEENTRPNDVILSWWDYGYWFENVANRPAIVDGGNLGSWGGVPRGKRDISLAKLFTSNQLNETHVQWLQDYGADYLLLDGSMVGKYSAVSFIAHAGGPDATQLRTVLPMGTQRAEMQVAGEKRQVPVLTYCFDRARRCQQGGGTQLLIPIEPNETGLRPVAAPRIQSQRGQAAVTRFCMPNGEEVTFNVSDDVQTVPGCLFYDDDPVKMGRAARRFNLKQRIPVIAHAPPGAADTVLARLLLQNGAGMPLFDVVQDNGFITIWRIRYDRFNDTAARGGNGSRNGLLQGLQ